METVTIIERHECLPFSELPEEVQEKVLEEHRDWNVDHDWWDSVYDWFQEHALTTYGITVDLEKTTFSGFWSQGDGAAFTGKVTNIETFLNALENPAYNGTYGVNLNKHGKRRVRYLFNECDLRFEAYRGNGFHNTQCSNMDKYNVNPHENYPSQEHHATATETILDRLESQWESICQDLASELYSSLEREYEYLTSAESLSETFDANECVFDIETGELFYCERSAA